MQEYIDLLIFNEVWNKISIGIVLLILIVLPVFIGLKLFNGMLNAQVTLFFNSYVMVGGFGSGVIGLEQIAHFFIIEFGFFMAVLFFYKKIILRNRLYVVTALKKMYSGKLVYLFMLVAVMVMVMIYFNASRDGVSRIYYMTAGWYTLVKPVVLILNPFLYLGSCVLIFCLKRKLVGYILVMILIASSVLSGSKASFVLSILYSFLIYRDLFEDYKLRDKSRDLLVILGLLMFSTIYVIDRLRISIDDLWVRMLLFGDANMLAYFSPDPTSLSTNLTIFARMHRGFARLLGDSSALNVDTLFGYALMIREFGVNNFVGPNARISAYFLVNFSDLYLIFGLIVLVLYFYLFKSILRKVLSDNYALALFCPFVISSLYTASQDFNYIMQSITISLLFFFSFAFYRSIMQSLKR